MTDDVKRDDLGRILPGKTLCPQGRAKGVPDIRTKMWDVAATCERMGYNPIESLINISMDPSTNKRDKVAADKVIMERVAPLLQRVESKLSGVLQIDTEGLKNKLQEHIDKIKGSKETTTDDSKTL